MDDMPIDDKIIFRIFSNGVENSRALGTQFTFLRSISISIYYILLLMIGKKIKFIFHEYLVVAIAHHDSDFIGQKYTNHIYRGRTLYRSLKEFLFRPSFVSGLAYPERMAFFVNSVYRYLKNRKRIIDFGTWMDFCAVHAFASQMRGKSLVARCHYDLLALWLGEFSVVYGFSFTVYQHGVVSKERKIQHRIFYTRLYVFDHYSKSVFKDNYVRNKNCHIEISSFEPSIHFQWIERKHGYKYIGIIEQFNHDWVLSIIDIIRRMDILAMIVVMKHPLSEISYAMAGKDVVDTKTKYINLDLLITEDSTLILDYRWAGSKIPAVITQSKMQEAFSEYDVILAEDVDSLKKCLGSVLIESQECKSCSVMQS